MLLQTWGDIAIFSVVCGVFSWYQSRIVLLLKDIKDLLSK